ncbi:hypothetical protein DSM104299_00994 [Baekduia alba]|uniref:hypothetical protein n=1 Tax=Baekduia alba TaxID=2997333 RepID=UPI00234240FD|nr:hypothetical protein [Baekduia alba]WCB92304.1 hypothetical protein DSM104299_00994 [Baekduia alba]
MAYRLNGTDPFLRASVGAFNGYNVRGAPASAFALVKRNATGGSTAWHGVYTMDQGNTSIAHDWLEFDPTDHLSGYLGNGAGYATAATFADTSNWMIVGFTWDGTASGWTWWWKTGAGAWQSESETLSAVFTLNAGAGFRHIVGNEPGLGDDANFDIVCVGAIKSQLTGATVQTLSLTSIASWDAVFTGPNAWLLGFDAIGSRSDRTGNGGDELARSAGITVVADPAGFAWGAQGGPSATTVRLSSVVAGRKTAQAAAAATVRFATTAAGSASPHGGPSSSSLKLAAAATGRKSTGANAAAAVHLSPAHAGRKTASGAAAAVVRFSVQAIGTGAAPRLGPSAATVRFLSSATGRKNGRNSGAVTLVLAAAATGHETAVGSSAASVRFNGTRGHAGRWPVITGRPGTGRIAHTSMGRIA